MPLPFEASKRGTLVERVRAIDGVRRAELDGRTGELWVERLPDHNEAIIERAIRACAVEVGQSLDHIDLRITAAPRQALRSRVRFLTAERLESGERTRITVDVEWADVVYRGAADCEADPEAELNCTAVAVLDALEKVIDQPLPFRVIGVAAISAFDSELMVAALNREAGSSEQLIGAVAVSDGQTRAAALATLSALNRAFGNFLHRPH